MRTTTTLDPDVAALVRRAMREWGTTFEETVNEAPRRALAGSGAEVVRTPEFSMGRPAVLLEHAVRVAADLDDAEFRRKLSTGK